jgi:sporulation protein YlmC with PRC-barrel domain
VGQHIFNSSRDILGTVIELIIDLKSNKLQYIVLATRPRFGVGKKLVAVPWKAFAIAEDKSGLILDIGLEQISNAPGFAKNDWPDMTHPYWTLQINSHYGLKTR